MARALVVAIACALATSATSYGDYAGARMPHYRMDYESRDAAPRDEYPERSPDAPVHLDYKYEEDPGGKLTGTPEPAVDVNEAWIKTKMRRNKPIDVENEYSQDVDKYASTDNREQKIKSSRVQLRNRHSFKRKKFDIEEETFTERERKRYYDDLKDASRENNVHSGGDRTINNRNIERNKKNIGYSRGDRRSGRRKARDKAMPLIDDVDEGMLAAERVFDTEDSGDEELERLTGQRRIMDPERVRVTQPDPDFTTKLGFTKPDRNYADYEEYYDMKRVLNIKNKLPDLLRRTKARYTTTQSTLHQTDWFRRANVPDQQEKQEIDVTPSAPSTASTTQSTTKARTTSKTTSKLPAKTITKSTTKSSKSSELSLAEKSRLSILKKAQRKESLKSGTLTTKPPVLMQVSQRMQTLVMVEPIGSEVQRMQAREISDNSPGRVAKAKRLMRHKLLSNARSIHDLTDNWDDMVCDYIDVSLLSVATIPHSRLFYEIGLASVLIILSGILLF